MIYAIDTGSGEENVQCILEGPDIDLEGVIEVYYRRNITPEHKYLSLHMLVEYLIQYHGFKKLEYKTVSASKFM